MKPKELAESILDGSLDYDPGHCHAIAEAYLKLLQDSKDNLDYIDSYLEEIDKFTSEGVSYEPDSFKSDVRRFLKSLNDLDTTT